jgi:hypothetical protein
MNDWRSEPARRHDDVTLPAIRVAFVLSLLIHGAALWTFLPHMRVLAPSPSAERGETGSPLAVNLVPLQGPPGSMPSIPAPPEALQPFAQSAPSHRSPPPPRATARAPSTPPMMTVPRPAPDLSQRPPAVAEAAPTPPTPAAEPDLASYVEARRRARGETAPAAQASSSTPPTEDENERRNRIIAANIGMNAKPTYGTDPKNGGGLFQMKSMDFAEAEFYFFGWNKDISRNAKQLIEVRRGENSDIRIAVVRR